MNEIFGPTHGFQHKKIQKTKRSPDVGHASWSMLHASWSDNPLKKKMAADK